MRLAVLSDIHSNREALEACLVEIRRQKVDQIACLGDIVGYAADPNICLDLVRENARHVVLGNHDAAVADASEAEYFNGDARAAIEWTRKQLSAANRAFLESLPFTRRLDDILLVHASPAEPRVWHYIFHTGDAEHHFQAFTERVCFHGHTHLPTCFTETDGHVEQRPALPFDLAAGIRALINVGSVGQPRDGDPRASFCIYDADAARIEFRRVRYDIAPVRDRILASELPRSGAERLIWGV